MDPQARALPTSDAIAVDSPASNASRLVIDDATPQVRTGANSSVCSRTANGKVLRRPATSLCFHYNIP